MIERYLALMGDLLGSASAAEATLTRDMLPARLAQRQPTAQNIEDLLLMAPTLRALSNAAHLMDLLENVSEEESSGLLAIYERRTQELQSAPSTLEQPL